MGKETERSVEMRRLLEEYGASGLSRWEFCQQRSIALTTFDYWRRVHSIKPTTQERWPRLLAVKVAATEPAADFRLSLGRVRQAEPTNAVERGCPCIRLLRKSWGNGGQPDPRNPYRISPSWASKCSGS